MTSKTITLLAAIACFSLTLIAQPKAPSDFKWEMVESLSDEFDSFDRSKWEYSLWNYAEPNIMKKSQAYVAEGKLCIKAELNDDSVRWMKTCRIMSKARISYPMYIECSMKAASISGYNTFWMNNGNGENRDEIDICENNPCPSNPNVPHRPEDKPYIMQSNMHQARNGENKTQPSYASTRYLSDDNELKGKRTDEAFHTYGLYWEDDRNCHFFLDGEYVGSSLSPRKFTRELNVYFDLWTNKWDGFAIKEDLDDNSKNTMYVDWVRTYLLQEIKH